MFCTRVAWVCLVCLLLCKEEGSFPVSAITERRNMVLYEVPLSISLLGIGMWTMLAYFHMCGIMLVLRAVFNMLVRNGSPRGPMCFRCLMFNLSGPCELLVLLFFIASWAGVGVNEMLYPCMFCVALLMLFLLLYSCRCLPLVIVQGSPAVKLERSLKMTTTNMEIGSHVWVLLEVEKQAMKIDL